MNAPRTPWEPLDPSGEGILARVVTDAGMGHVGVFDSADLARSACEAVNRFASVLQERDELAAECGRLRTELASREAAK